MNSLIVITCGPASEPIDEVRRITNFSTGELGVLLANALVARGHRVLCCKGTGATWPDPTPPCEVRHFTRNADLLILLQDILEPVAAVFHVAALADFLVDSVENSAGTMQVPSKISSDAIDLTIHLSSAPKILPKLRTLFSDSFLAAWKYELEGTHEEALAKGRNQIIENLINVSVVNGRAYGPGFGVLTSGTLQHLPDKHSLCEHLASLV